ncbi:2OG-Fe(II) oxygenase [Streptomyces sp. NPDC051662]|uniref:2OG-Fe(II) oxygenase n=1 Tax=Streptomyces sp. NPDC051662 TaxID=3154750 RepID=UPI00342BEABA
MSDGPSTTAMSSSGDSRGPKSPEDCADSRVPGTPGPPDGSGPSGAVLDLPALRRAELAERPYHWAELSGTLLGPPGRTARQLEEEFPARGFRLTERTGGDSEKTYRTRNLPLITRGRPVAESLAFLSPLWRRLVDELASPGYRAAVAEATGCPLGRCVIEARAVRYGPGYWIAPHTDRPDKVVTQLWYFNSEWPARWQGSLRILGSPAADDIRAEIAPRPGSSVLLVRSADSWHSVTPVSAAASQDRRTLLVHFVDPTADTGSGDPPPGTRVADVEPPGTDVQLPGTERPGTDGQRLGPDDRGGSGLSLS